MPTIINKLDYAFTPAEEQEIFKAATHKGVDTVYTQRDQAENLFHFFGQEENGELSDYLFSIDIDADGSAEIWEKA